MIKLPNRELKESLFIDSGYISVNELKKQKGNNLEMYLEKVLVLQQYPKKSDSHSPKVKDFFN